MKFEKEYREAWPETIGEKDTQFDMLNYSEYLENRLLEIREAQKTPTNKQSLQLPNYKEVWNDAWQWYSDRVSAGEKLGWEFQKILYEFLVRQQ